VDGHTVRLSFPGADVSGAYHSRMGEPDEPAIALRRRRIVRTRAARRFGEVGIADGAAVDGQMDANRRPSDGRSF
jgi:hypothetical protein